MDAAQLEKLIAALLANTEPPQDTSRTQISIIAKFDPKNVTNFTNSDIETVKTASLDTVLLKAEQCKGKRSFLIDTASSISLIKLIALKDDAIVSILEKPLEIEGIGDGTTKIKWFIDLNLEGKLVRTFFVVDDDFKIDQDGIIGNDFVHDPKVRFDFHKKVLKIDKTKFKINSEKKTLCMKTKNSLVQTIDEFSNTDEESSSSGETDSNVSSDHSDDAQKTGIEADDAKFDKQSSQESLISSESVHLFREESDDEEESGAVSLKNISRKEFQIPLNSEINFDDQSDDKEFDSDVSCASKISESQSDFSGDDFSESCTDDEDGGSNLSFSNSEECEMKRIIPIPKISPIYAKVRVNDSWVELTPEMKFSDEVFTVSCDVISKNNETLIPFFNNSDKSVNVNVQVISLLEWKKIHRIKKEHNSLVVYADELEMYHY